MKTSNPGCLAYLFGLVFLDRLDKIERNTRRTADLLDPNYEEPHRGAPPIASRERDKRWEEQLRKAAEEEQQARVEQARQEMANEAEAANSDLDDARLEEDGDEA